MTNTTPDGHADYPHEPFTLYDCPACENTPCGHTGDDGEGWCVSTTHGQPLVTVYRVWRGPVGDAPVLSEDTERYLCVPDEFDVEEGLSAVDMAVNAIRDGLFMSGPDCASALVAGGIWPGPHTWFSAEPYQHPYEDKREEVTAHLSGWTDADAETIWRRVTAV